MQTVADITFIGGGISGLLTARLFALAGAKVTIIDKGFIGQESSWAGGGILSPLYPWRQSAAVNELFIESIRLYPELITSLLQKTQLDPEYQVSGILINKLDDLALAKKWYQQHKFNITAVPEQYAAYSDEQSLYLPDVAQVRNPRLLKALKQDLLLQGVDIIEQCAIENISLNKNKITQIESKTQSFSVNQLVITSGAWTGNLWKTLFADSLGIVPNIRPVKGQMLIFDSPLGVLDTMILEHDRYLIPRRDGKILCGSTIEYQQFDKTITDQAQQSLAKFAHKICPDLSHIAIEKQWAGLRPATEHGIPYIDTHPEITNLAINAGHFRNGFAIGTAAAQLLYELITQQTPILNPTPYQLSAQH